MGRTELIYPADMETWKRQKEELKVVSFLAALGPQYASPKILTSTELPNLNCTFSRLSRIQVEVDPPVEQVENTALVTATRPISNSSGERVQVEAPFIGEEEDVVIHKKMKGFVNIVKQ